MAKTPFSRNLKSLRRARGLSQQKLAQEVGLRRSNIASYESGTAEPNAVNFLKVTYFFEVDPCVFYESELVDHPIPNLPAFSTMDQIQGALTRFLEKTCDAEKIELGFTEYLRLHPNHRDGNDLKSILDLLRHLVKMNKRFIEQ